MVEEITLLNKIQKNNTKEQEVQKELEKKINKHEKTLEWSIWMERYIFQTTRRYKSRSYKKTMNQQIQNTQDNKEYLS